MLTYELTYLGNKVRRCDEFSLDVETYPQFRDIRLSSEYTR